VREHPISILILDAQQKNRQNEKVGLRINLIALSPGAPSSFIFVENCPDRRFYRLARARE
jgi:hypothetical protein